MNKIQCERNFANLESEHVFKKQENFTIDCNVLKKYIKMHLGKMKLIFSKKLTKIQLNIY